MCNRQTQAQAASSRTSIGLTCCHVFVSNLCEDINGRNVDHSGCSKGTVHQHMLCARVKLPGMLPPRF
jgi:hypothetical protein